MVTPVYIPFLYFGPCSKDVGIYFPALCASIVHDVCIYILACPLLVWLSQSMSPKAKRCLISTGESKVTCCRIFTWKSGIYPKALGKHRLGSHPFKSQTSKPSHVFKAPNANVKIMIFTANIRKLRFIKTNDYPLTGIVGCLTSSLHETKLPDTRIKIFSHPH